MRYGLLKGVFVILGLALIVSKRAVSDGGVLAYPGNGIPYFSQNIEIEGLRDDLAAYGRAFPGTCQRDGTLVFQQVRSFDFKPGRRLGSGKLCLRLGVEVTEGVCHVSIGNLSYTLRRNGVVIEDSGRTIYSNDVAHVRSISIEAFSSENVSTRLHTENELIAVRSVRFITPASIHIRLEDGSSGSLGPWHWLRGYM